MTTETEKIIIRINEDLKARFKARVEDDGLNMSYVIKDFIKEYTYDRKLTDNR